MWAVGRCLLPPTLSHRTRHPKSTGPLWPSHVASPREDRVESARPPAHLATGTKPRTPCRTGVRGESEREGSVCGTCVEKAGRGTNNHGPPRTVGAGSVPRSRGRAGRGGAHVLTDTGKLALLPRGQKAGAMPASGTPAAQAGLGQLHVGLVAVARLRASLLLPAPRCQGTPPSVLWGKLCTHTRGSWAVGPQGRRVPRGHLEEAWGPPVHTPHSPSPPQQRHHVTCLFTMIF